MTINTPSEPGMYWVTWNYDEQRHAVRLVKHLGENAYWYVEVPGWGNRFQVDYFRDWFGPITEQDAERLKEAVGIIERILFIAEEGAAVDDEPMWTKAREFVRQHKERKQAT